ncbi:MAG: DUF4921 family protein [Corynebacterium sp.]|nr:DUF4921 family protein [Corynebacterium sp.]
MDLPTFSRNTLISKMADGTIKQVNPFSGSEVWTVPGRGNRPLARPKTDPKALSDTSFTHTCAFCSANTWQTPPEKARMVRTNDGGWELLRNVPALELETTLAEFRRVPNLFEILSYDYWQQNYDYAMPTNARNHMDSYLLSAVGREHVAHTVATKLRAAGKNPEVTSAEMERLAEPFFGGGHDVIIARRHYIDGAETEDQLCSSGMLSAEEHFVFIQFTIAALADLYHQNRYAPYVAVFQNWLQPAGASFEHLHKQLVAMDDRGVSAQREIQRLRTNPNMYNELAVDYAAHHNLILAENDHAICFAGFGHQYPTLEVYSKSATSEPWLQSVEEIRDMSDLLHACHAAAGPDIPCNEEWHHKPVDADIPMPWRIMVKWRVSTLAGFEGGTKVYVNTISPWDLRDRVVTQLYALRDQGRISADIRIATECQVPRNSLQYNPNLWR